MLLIKLVIGARLIFRRIQFIVLDPTVVRDNQAFRPWFVLVGICSAIAILFKPPTSRQSNHCSIDQKTSERTQKSSTSPGKYYKNAFLSHQVRCCIGDGCVRPGHLSFVTWWIWDLSFLCRDLLGRIPLSVLIIWQCNRRWRFQFHVNQWLESICLVQAFFDDEYIVDPHAV